MAFLAGLKSQLKSRRDYVDASSSVAEGLGEGFASATGRFFSFADFKDKSETGYVGLTNQGLTYIPISV